MFNDQISMKEENNEKSKFIYDKQRDPIVKWVCIGIKGRV